MANMTLTKTPMPEQDPKIRARNFKEVTLGYTAEMAMEDDYGMLDGIINNGKAPATDERPSVLVQLKEMSLFDAPHKPSRSHPERDIE